MRPQIFTWLIAWFFVTISSLAASPGHARQPNVVLIMTDNQGAWTLGCYGNPDIRTPHIDRLAAEGIRFTRCFSSNAVCSPTRATWLTGLMPSQHGVHCYISPKVQIGPNAFSTLEELRSLPEIFRDTGYTCGLSGKWHLGLNMQPQEGFSFWVTKPGGSTSEFYNQDIIENGKIHRLPGYQTDYWTDRGIEFIRKNKDRPFFLFLSYNGPYGLSPMLLNKARNRHASYYADKQLVSFPRQAMHPWMYHNRDYLNNIVSMRRYAAEISGVDDGVGRIMEALKATGLDDDTLVIFAGDQGLAGGQSGIWGMGDHTRPLTAFDSTMHVPLIFRWPKSIARGATCDFLVSNYDLFTSLLPLLGLESQIPKSPPRPGRNFAAVLRGDNVPNDWDNTVYYEFETVRAVRTDRWKLVTRMRGGPSELYDLKADPGEMNNLFGRPAMAATEKKLQGRLEKFFQKYVDPKYDLAHGGTSKAQFLLSDAKPVVRASLVDRSFTLDATTARFRGGKVHVEEDLRSMAGWAGPDDRVFWSVRGVKAGQYFIRVLGRSDATLPGGHARPSVELDGKKLADAWRAGPNPKGEKDDQGRRRSFELGPVELSPGNHEIAFGPTDDEGLPGFTLRSIRLVPARLNSTSAADVDVESRTVESKYLRLVLSEDLNGVEHLVDKRTQRDYATTLKRPLGLYTLGFGRGPTRSRRMPARGRRTSPRGRRVSATSVVSKKLIRQEDGVKLEFEHKGTYPATVTCTISGTPDEAGIRWRITVGNRTHQPLYALEYPILNCQMQLGNSSSDDAIVYPQHEGVLLTDPKKNMNQNDRVAKAYPGAASVQFMYFFDSEGGLYLGAHDTAAHTKTPVVSRGREHLQLSWVHDLPSVNFGRTSLAYDVVCTVAGGRWQAGADIYRNWAQRDAPWCQRKIQASEVPEWLQRANLFLTYTLDTEGRFYPAEKVDEALSMYRKYFGLPVVASPFGWEKPGSLIGPDCFPPNGGEEYYVDLAERLAQREDHMLVATTGFRWGLRKPRPAQPTNRGSVNRQDPDYREWIELWSGFRQRMKRVAALDASLNLVWEREAWNENYLMCVGCIESRKLISDCFSKIFDFGVAGIDLGQIFGAGTPHCYSNDHGHSPGAGRWEYRSMSEFLTNVRKNARENNRDSFIGVEEPCEVYIPVIDIVRGRAFTDTHWPADAPGGVSIPLYIYLYHEYQLNYAGWIDAEFSPFADVRYGIGRATIFGMQPGVRIGDGPFEYLGNEPSAELKMLRDAAKLMNRCDRFLLHGRMLYDPRIDGSPNIDPKAVSGRDSLPLAWPVVQATSWRSNNGDVCYAVANLSADQHEVLLHAVPDGKDAARARLLRIDAAREQVLHDDLRIPANVPVTLEPWQICCIVQTSDE